MLYLDLKPIFNARGILKPYSYLVSNGFSSHSANMITNGETRAIRLDHIESLCELLMCDPTDIFSWTPDSKKNIPLNNPLYKLVKSDSDKTSLREALSNLPYKELKEVTAKVTAEIKGQQDQQS